MINLNDPFTGLLVVLLILVVFSGYLAFFGKVEKRR